MREWRSQRDRYESIPGGGGDGGGNMEARVAVLEQIAQDTKDVLKELKTEASTLRSNQERDFRLLFGAIIAATLGLAGLMAKGFHWI
ncbi:hypothetical protein D3W54_01170 [Komagataeibacter medellinensis]|uniref:Uncharacterized protein n=2 Tax=Komagataeibacter medellinensis TaxID=1177712 RepID=A0ABQ6W3A3_9PROT|nr:hypothetical protein D3W54_01170 [Komagataeibacter medellinensis]